MIVTLSFTIGKPVGLKFVPGPADAVDSPLPVAKSAVASNPTAARTKRILFMCASWRE